MSIAGEERDGIVSEGMSVSSSSSVPFPPSSANLASQSAPVLVHSESSSSNLTSSDKLSALPGIHSSPALDRLLQATRPARRSLDAPGSQVLPSLESASPGLVNLSRFPSRASGSENSVAGRETPKQRVSFESDHVSLPATFQNIRQVDLLAMSSRVSQRNDPSAASPFARSEESSHPASQSQRPTISTSPRKQGATTPHSASPSQSRAASPLRWFGWNLHRAHSRDEPFIPVDPFRIHFPFFASPSSTPQRSSVALLDVNCATCLPLPTNCTPGSKFRFRSCAHGLRKALTDTLPRHIYLHSLFRLPALYFSRVARIFEDAEVSKHEIQRMIEACAPANTENDLAAGIGANLGISAAFGPARSRNGGSVFPFPEDWNPPTVSPALSRFKHSWELFVDTLIREWKTLNLVSVLLCTAILTMFQIQDAAGDPLTRFAALFSLIFAIMSLTYGCVYIVQFGAMRSMYKASRWAEEAQKTKTFIWWNIWVLLAMPAIWLAWAMVAFCVAILSYIWRTGSSADPSDGTRQPLSPSQALAVRIVLTAVFTLGLVYFVMALRTFASYGEREAGWRRSWLATRHPRMGERARERRRPEEDRDRERGRRRERDRQGQGHERERSPDVDGKQSPITGLGLLGVSGSSVKGFASVSSVLAEDSDGEKGEKRHSTYPMGDLKGKVSPKL
ncbi:uncharacterized protein PHACADRAFT_25094 [Phanerochaete carnosa HHB-10118-sp]|uniref:Uncharacterized protein n=1 Tax=Phanerochaete carnosa (strain HHB-10118-sp) TaxID=650164 RepID=K5WHW7_PHACS|nr:uncharacterized protein PHACADRAFT_25094 [Phanerochaete carnosa HHB-10118-sp]EKM58945.1 hypothetical protein PHACADRAFT_25094 [Phanerochaete carnosa HHB-10118-sp]